MLDFDFMCKREKPSVACMVFPFSGNHYIKFYWGTVRNVCPLVEKCHPACIAQAHFAEMTAAMWNQPHIFIPDEPTSSVCRVEC